MRTLVIHASKDLRIEERDPGRMKPGQVTVRVEVGGICGSDLHYFNHGGFGSVRLQEPMILGHEVAGSVIEVAPDVTLPAPGDRVAVNPSQPCGRCSYCLEGLSNHCLDMLFYGSAMRMPHVQGAFRDLLVCDAAQCEVATDVSVSELALAEPFAVALHAVGRAGSLVGRNVLVTGCGPIGALVIAAARFHGSAEIIATDVVDEPLVVAQALGADRTINTAQYAAGLSRFATEKGYFDVMFECSGNERALSSGLETVRPRGMVVQLGLGGAITVQQNLIVSRELSILGSFRFQMEFGLAVRLIRRKRVNLRPLLTGTFSLDEAQRAFENASDRRRSMKVQLTF